ncbi:hypothetical protein VPH35_025918 [Triticum aestivum]
MPLPLLLLPPPPLPLPSVSPPPAVSTTPQVRLRSGLVLLATLLVLLYYQMASASHAAGGRHLRDLYLSSAFVSIYLSICLRRAAQIDASDSEYALPASPRHAFLLVPFSPRFAFGIYYYLFVYLYISGSFKG